MTSVPGAPEPDPSKDERRHEGDLERSSIDYAASSPSTLRWLLVLAPIIVLAAAAWNLVDVFVVEQATREQRMREDVLPPADGPSDPASLPTIPFPPIDLGPAQRDQTMGEGAPAPGAPPAADASFDVAKAVNRISSSSPPEGAVAVRLCQPCHVLAKNASGRIGPNLWGVVGRAKAANPGYAYSQALRQKGGTWTYDELALFLHNPRAAVPGTAMAFGGISDEAKIASIIAYLRTLSDAPVALP